jgi:hypothetical protein
MALPTQPRSTLDLLNEHIRWSDAARQAEQAQMMAAQNQTIKTLSDLASMSLFGNTTEQLQRSRSLGDQIMGHAMPALATFGADMLGWSPMSMITASQQAARQGGFTLRSMDGSETVPVYGGMAAHSVGAGINSAMNRFFQPGGALNLGTTYGASREDIAAVTQDLQQRGAFAGHAGTFETLTSERMAQLKSQAQGNPALAKEMEGLAVGDQIIHQDPGLSGRVGDTIQSALRATRELRELLGNFKPQELFSEMERLTGMNFDPSKAGSMSQAVTQLQTRVAHGASVGLDSRTTLELGAATASTMDAVMAARTGLSPGSFYGAAAQLTGAANQHALVAWREQQQGGGYRNLSEVMATTAGDMARIVTETPEMIEAALGAARTNPGEGRDALLASIKAFGNAGTVDARMEARRNMARVYSDVTGLRPGAMIGAYGPDALLEHLRQQSPEMLSSIADASMNSNRNSMIGDFQRITSMEGSNSPYNRALGGANRSAQFAMEMFQTVGGTDMRNLQSALQAGNMTEATRIASGFNLPTFGNAGTALGYADQRITDASGGRQSVRDYMASMQQSVQLSERLAPLHTQGALGNSSTVAASYLRQMNAAEGGPLSLWTQVEQGLLSDSAAPLGSQQLLNYAQNNGDEDRDDLVSIGFDKKTHGMEFADKKAVQDFEAVMRSTKIGGLQGINLFSKFSLKDGDFDGLEKALKDPANVAQVHAWAKQGGLVMGPNDKGGVDILKDPAKTQDAYNAAITKLNGSSTSTANASSGTKGDMTVNLHMPNGGIWGLIGDFMMNLIK